MHPSIDPLGRALALAPCAGGVAGPASAPHAAACVAALKAQEAELAESVKAGEPREPVLLKVVRSGIAIIGTQYLAGLREVEARELLKAAERDFQALPPARGARATGGMPARGRSALRACLAARAKPHHDCGAAPDQAADDLS